MNSQERIRQANEELINFVQNWVIEHGLTVREGISLLASATDWVFQMDAEREAQLLHRLGVMEQDMRKAIYEKCYPERRIQEAHFIQDLQTDVIQLQKNYQAIEPLMAQAELERITNIWKEKKATL